MLYLLVVLGASGYTPKTTKTPLPPDDLVVPTELSRLITQRAVQCQLYYCELNRDSTSRKYLATRSGVDPEFHGTDGLAAKSSRDLVCGLFADADREIVVRLGGWRSRPVDNPYIKAKHTEYRVALRPGALAERLLESRAQIALECAADLGLFEDDERALDRRRRQILFRDSKREKEMDAACREALPPFDETRFGDTTGRSSPLRAGTYDLLKQLATRKAVEGVIEERRTTRSEDAKVLEALWEARSHKFKGGRAWKRADPSYLSPADDLLIAFRSKPPSIIGNTLLDPLALLDEIFDRRRAIAQSWVEALANVPEENLRWRKWHLVRSLATAPPPDLAALSPDEH